MAGIRRTWDKALYEQKAKDRLEYGEDYVEESKDQKGNRAKQALREEFQAASAGASGPIGSERAFLKSREHRLGLDDKAGKIEIINPADVEGQKAGFWCEVCSVLLKDSASYLGHVNGKRHQAALGYSMRVERSSIDDVKERLQKLKSRVSHKSSTDTPQQSSNLSEATLKAAVLEEYESKLKADEKEKEDLKRRRKEEATARKKQRLDEEINENMGSDEDYDDNDEMAKMMGFKSFGTCKRK